MSVDKLLDDELNYLTNFILGGLFFGVGHISKQKKKKTDRGF
jgi:hypothetical protein